MMNKSVEYIKKSRWRFVLYFVGIFAVFVTVINEFVSGNKLVALFLAMIGVVAFGKADSISGFYVRLYREKCSDGTICKLVGHSIGNVDFKKLACWRCEKNICEIKNDVQ